MHRAYLVLDCRAFDDEEWVVEGVASTPTADRMDDIVEPLGAKFALPMPFLLHHDSRAPVGHVEFAKPAKTGIPFRARIVKPTPDMPQVMRERLLEAWHSLKTKLIRAVSIGFRELDHEVLANGGWRFTKWEWLELSLVTIPANAEATITTIRSIDEKLRADPGQKQDPDDRGRELPGSAGKTSGQSRSVSIHPKGKTMPKTIAEQIRELEATRQVKTARLTEIQDLVSGEGRTKDEAEREEFDTLAAEIKSIDAELKDLDGMQKLNLSKAVVIDDVKSPEDASRLRAAPLTPILLKGPELPKGIGFTRYVIALARAKGNIMQAAEIAKGNERWMAETPDVLTILRTAVAAGNTTDTTWASPLVQYTNLASEFIEFLRPLTIIGRLRLRQVPFKVKIPRQTGGASANWVGEGKVKPVTSAAFDSVTLDHNKIAGIIVLTEELVRLGDPSAEQLIRDDLAAAVVQFMDSQFVDPTKAADDVSPASITNGVTPITATGTDLDALKTDVFNLIATFLDSNLSLGDAAWIMTQQQAAAIGMMRNALGQREYPEMNANGGVFEGFPVVASENITATGGSPTDGYPLILAKQQDILLADDGQVMIDASREASIQMETAPDSPATASTVLTSLWQHNMVGLRAERMVTWKKRRSESVGFIQNAKYRP